MKHLNISEYKFLLILTIIVLISIKGFSQTAEVIKLPQLEGLFSKKEDTTYIFNFMATWCKPCMEELPHFEKVMQENRARNIKLIYISMDAVQDLDKKLNKVIVKKNLQNKVYLLNEPDYNSWINKIEKSWDGAIPVTFMINNKQNTKSFFPKKFSYEELSQIVKNLK